MRQTKLGNLAWVIGFGFLLVLKGTPARAADKLLDETVDFTGTILISAKVPGMVIGAIRDGETVVHGYGEIADGSGKTPDGGYQDADWLDHQGVLRRHPCLHESPTAGWASPTGSRTGSAGT